MLVLVLSEHNYRFSLTRERELFGRLCYESAITAGKIGSNLYSAFTRNHHGGAGAGFL